MIVCKLAYRHQNGDVEGFVGVGFSEEAANRDLIRMIHDKLASINRIYDPRRLIRSEKGITDAEMATIRSDWKRECGEGIAKQAD